MYLGRNELWPQNVKKHNFCFCFYFLFLRVYLDVGQGQYVFNTLHSVLQFCNEYAVPKDKLQHFKDITAQDIVCSQVLVSFRLE